MSELKDRLEIALTKSGKTKIELARYCGLSHPSVSNWFNGKTKQLTAINAIKASEFLGVSLKWLTEGVGNPDDSMVLPSDESKSSDDYIIIPEYRVRCGAGSEDSPSFEEATESKPAYYRREWFTERGLNPAQCRRLKVHGDSMMPILFDGDTILCDCRKFPIVSGKVYAFCFADEVRVKRLYKKLNGGVIVHSENPNMEDEEILPNEMSKFYLIGRVVDRSGSGPF